MNMTSSIPHPPDLTVDSLIPRTINYPFYYSSAPSLIPSLTDKNLSLILPVVTYWLYALCFVFLDSRRWAILDKYRVHTPEELKQRNHVPPLRVASFVLVQQAVGVLLSILTVKEDDGKIWPDDHAEGMKIIAPYVLKTFQILLGKHTTSLILGPSVISFIYWYALPVAQYAVGFFAMETWQYWIHRLSHQSLFMYKHFHHWHHEIYVPYAFAALYAHPIEALLLNVIGAAIGFQVPRLTTRQAMFLFVFSTCKAVDDHSGYRWPRFGPGGNENGWFCLNVFQCLFGENSEFHDLHHHAEGQRYNFSQPFTTFWDRVCGTHSLKFAHPPHGLGLRTVTTPPSSSATAVGSEKLKTQ